MRKVLCLVLLFVLPFFCVKIATATPKEVEELSQIETQIFGYTYDKESEQNRLERLESYAYGNKSSGNNAVRIAKLKKDLAINIQVPKEQNSQKIAENTDDDFYYEKPDATAKYPIVDILEEKIFHKVSLNDDIYVRIAKLEKQIFKKENKNLSLNERVDKLKSAVITDVAIAGYDDDGNVTITPTYSSSQTTKHNFDFDNSFDKTSYFPSTMGRGSLYNEISILERNVLNSTHPTLAVEERLSQLEKKILQRVYADDDFQTRVERLAAAAEAQKSYAKYSGSKFEKNLATGVQIAGFILMILALVL